MGVVLSSLVFTKVDQLGNPYAEAYITFEFRDARYTPGGEAMDISSVMRHILMPPTLTSLSGANQAQEPRPNSADYPGNAGSGRAELYYTGSGLGISVLSGTVNIAPGLAKVELLSGTAVSGTRMLIHAIGA